MSTAQCPAGESPLLDTSGEYVCLPTWSAPPRPEPPAPIASTVAAPTAPVTVEVPAVDSGPGLGSVVATVMPMLAVAVLVGAAVLAVTSLHRDGRAAIRSWVAAVATGARRLGLRALWRWAWHDVPSSKRWRVRAFRVGVLVGATLVASTWILGALPLILQPLVLLAALGLLGAVRRRQPTEVKPEAWWGERRLVGALRSAGVLATAKAGEPPVVLRRHGAPRTDQRGTSVTFALPGAHPWTEVLARRDRLASALDVPARLLTITHDDDQAEGVLTLWVGVPQSRGVVASPLAGATSTRWADPVRIGTDERGQPVVLATDEANTLLAGQPGSGKTTLARTILGHYLLDASTSIFLLDGKGSRADYGAARDLCARFVSGVDDDAVEATEAMLDEVLGIVRDRNAKSGDGACPGDGAHRAGVLLLLEEFQDVRAAASKADRESLDAILGRIVRMGRAVGVHVVVSTQRPTVDDLPSGVRNLISQRVALMLRNAADAALVLGSVPTLPLPSRRGEALLATPAGIVAVTLDLLDAGGWAALCARAASLRPRRPAPEPEPALVALEPAVVAAVAPTALVPALQALEPVRAAAVVPAAVVPAAVVAPEPVRDPLHAAALEVLADSDPRGLPATALLALLPDWLAPVTPAALGKALRGCDGLERGHVGKSPVWRLRRRVGVPSVWPRSSPRSEGSEARSGPRNGSGRAQDGPSGARPSGSSEVAP